MERFRIAATGHSLNYLPEYIAHEYGFFGERGFEVTVSAPPPWAGLLDGFADGTAAASLGGIWVPSMCHDRMRKYTAFAQVGNRAPLALVGRGHTKGLKLADTVERTVLMKRSNGASIGLFFRMPLRENGIDPKSVEYV